MLSFSQIRAWAATHAHEDPTDTLLTTLLLRYVNDALGEIASAHRWRFLEGMQTLTLGAHGDSDADTGSGVTYFPDYVQDILSIWPADRGYRENVQIIGAWELDNLRPSQSQGQIADYLVVWGFYNTSRDVSSAGTVTATASGGASADGCQVVIEGINNATGLEHRETLTLSSGTATSSANWKSGVDGVRRIYVVDSSIDGSTVTESGVGTITVTDSNAATLETLNVAIGERMHEHLRTEINPPPSSSGGAYVVRYYKKIRPIVSTDDVVEIPQEFEQMLFFGISRRLAEFRGELDLATYYDTLLRKRIYELKLAEGRRPSGRLRALRGLRHYHYRNPGRWGY